MNDENLIPAKKGEVRNPKGKPKGTLNYSTLIKRLLAIDIDKLNIEDESLKQLYKKLGIKTTRELILFAQVQKALQGDTTSFNALADREVGKPKQHNVNENIERTYEDYLDGLPDDDT